MCTIFINKERTEIMDLKNSVGLVYHMKLYKNKVIYVKNTKEVMVMDIETRDIKCIGKAGSQILALHVYDSKVTSLDKEILRRDGIEVNDVVDDEENKENYTETEIGEFRIVTIDSKARVNLFIWEGDRDIKHLFDIRKSTGFPEELLKKDFFSMGYPYIITAYYNMIAFCSDYGVWLFKLDESLLAQ